VLDDRCPVAVVREFLGGVFGADGQAPILKCTGEREAGDRWSAGAQSLAGQDGTQLSAQATHDPVIAVRGRTAVAVERVEGTPFFVDDGDGQFQQIGVQPPGEFVAHRGQG